MTGVIASSNKVLGMNGFEKSVEPVAVDCVNIDAVMEVLNENMYTIKSMRARYKEKEKLINTTMQVYSTYKMKFSKAQINAFREFVACTHEESSNLKEKIAQCDFDESLKSISEDIMQGAAYDKVFKKLNGINSIQVEIMDILCDMTERAERFLSIL